MAKKKSWYNIVKRFFIRETNSKQEMDRRRKWIFGGLKIKRLASLTAPSSLNERNLGEAEEEQIKHALAVARATIAAAEAAVTTALVATEIVWFTSTSQYNHQYVNEVEGSVIRVQREAPQSNYQCVRESMNLLPLEFSLPFGFTFLCLKKARKALRGKGIMRQSCKMPNHNYPKALAVHCNYSITRLHKNIWNGGRHLELCWK